MNRLMQIRGSAAALEAAQAHGLLGALAAEPATVEQLAGELGLDAVACDRILRLLSANGVVEHENGLYRLPDSLRLELLGPDAAPGGGFWTHAADFLATGGGPTRVEDTVRGVAYGEATPYLARMLAPLAARLAEHVARTTGLGEAPTILDVGAGAGVWSLALLERIPGARARSLDLEPVLPRFLERAASLGLEARVEARAGDYQTAPIDDRFDVVLLANVVHLEPPAAAAELIRRWAAALRPGGRMLIVDVLSESGAEPAHAAYALHLAMRIRGAYPHLEPDLRRWLTAAGLDRIERALLSEEPVPYGALIARGGTDTSHE